MGHEDAAVTSTGNMSATFRVPGMVSIPCDGAAHNFTIVELRPQATMSWVAVPKREPKTHLTVRVRLYASCPRTNVLQAHITNKSEYTLLRGTASVYVDGSFIAHTTVPAVSLRESFDCPLGCVSLLSVIFRIHANLLTLTRSLDPSIRITYHPAIKKRSESGFYTKSATHGVTQRITVHNTKNVPVERLRIVDQVPASRHEQIKVRLVQPPLALREGTVKPGANAKAVGVGAGVVAQWDGGDEQDRRVSWVCMVPAQGKISLALEWTATVSPADAQVIGL
jgi:hypothetical protein